MSTPPGLVLSLDAATLDHLAELVSVRVVKALEATLPVSGDAWMDSKQAAAYLGLPSVHALHKLTAAREVPCVQDVAGGRLYFKRSELDRWRGA